MKLHEYQAKEILKKFNVPIPEGRVAFTPEEARKVAEDLGGGSDSRRECRRKMAPLKVLKL